MPLIPFGFNITNVEYTLTDIMVSFEWDEPQGRGLETIVDNYIISVFPRPLYPLGVNTLPNSQFSFNVTLNYNTVYRVSIAAVNCAGESEIFEFPNIKYGM